MESNSVCNHTCSLQTGGLPGSSAMLVRAREARGEKKSGAVIAGLSYKVRLSYK